jgi:hypothetical protein
MIYSLRVLVCCFAALIWAPHFNLSPFIPFFVSAEDVNITTFAGFNPFVDSIMQFRYPRAVGVLSDGLTALMCDTDQHMIRFIVSLQPPSPLSLGRHLAHLARRMVLGLMQDFIVPLG